jgi:acyl-CoA thioesterase-1
MKYAVAAFLAMMSLVFAEHAPAAEPKAILVFGDSLSEGFMLNSSEAYPALLAKKLRAAGLNFSVTNASATGGQLTAGWERLPPHLKHRIDILILELGINDAFRGVPIDQIQNNLQQIIDKVKARNPNARLVIAECNSQVMRLTITFPHLGQMFADLRRKIERRWCRIYSKAWQAILR